MKSTKLAPKAFRTQMVALNFLSVALGTATAGAVAFGLLLALASPLIRELMSGVR